MDKHDVLIEKFGPPKHTETCYKIITIPKSEILLLGSRECAVDAFDCLVEMPESMMLQAVRAYLLGINDDDNPIVEEADYHSSNSVWELTISGEDDEELNCKINLAFEHITAWNLSAAAENELALRWFADRQQEKQEESDPLGLFSMDELL